MNLLEFIR